MYGFTTDEYGRLKTYLKNHKIKTEPSAISTSPVSPGPFMNHISNQNTVSVYPRQIHPEIQERRESTAQKKSLPFRLRNQSTQAVSDSDEFCIDAKSARE